MMTANEIKQAIKTIEVAIAEVEWNYPLDYAIAFETALEALTEKLNCLENPPLTVEELKEVGQKVYHWVWIEVLVPFDYYLKTSNYYQVHKDYTNGEALCCGYPGLSFGFDICDYGKTWLAYRNKPEREG